MNFRRIFEERAYDLHGHVLSLSDTRLFCDLPNGFTVCEEHRDTILRRAEGLLDKSYPPLIATDYIMFKRDGNRSIYEGKYFMRRDDILTLVLAEHVENKGRFTDAIVNLLWAIEEETTWVVPAHNPQKDGTPMSLPYAYAGEVDYIDLFSAATAADLSFVYALMKDKLDAVSPLLCERLLVELERRIVRPFLDDDALARTMWWSGLKGNKVNNWNPWIISNVLTVCALTVKDDARREAIVKQAMRLLNSFTAVYHDDGGCDEGPGYWGAAGAALFDACCLLYDLTGGFVNVFDDPLLRRMGEYKVNVFIADNRFLNFADASARISPAAELVYDWGMRVQSDRMISYGRHFLDGKLPGVSMSSSFPYRSFRQVCLRPDGPVSFEAPTKIYLDGLQIAVTREGNDPMKGMFLAFKGGHNAESHNHCDVGTVTVFSDGRPLFIDAGSGAYTARTFGPDRYTIWSMRSDYHNVISVNNCVQFPGENARADHPVYDETSGALSLDLTQAYPKEANLRTYIRTASLTDGTVTLTDEVSLNGEGTVAFHFLVTEAPGEVTPSSFSLGGRTVRHDPSLTLSVEPCDHTQAETANLASAWDTDTLYRLTLTSDPFTSHVFRLTVSK